MDEQVAGQPHPTANGAFYLDVPLLREHLILQLSADGLGHFLRSHSRWIITMRFQIVSYVFALGDNRSNRFF